LRRKIAASAEHASKPPVPSRLGDAAILISLTEFAPEVAATGLVLIVLISGKM
jgi:hypothetical protein